MMSFWDTHNIFRTLMDIMSTADMYVFWTFNIL